MTIKLLTGNPCNMAMVSFSKNDFVHMGLRESEITLKNKKARQLLGMIFNALLEYGGLRREGNYVSVNCRPLKNGGCRFYIQFTDQPSGRLFAFAEADDLLDALSQLQKCGKEDILAEIEIFHSDGNYQIYIPAGLKISKNALAILSEYSV